MCTRQGGRGGGGEGSRGFTGEVGFQARACGTAELTEYWLTGPGCGWRSSSARSHSCKASGLPVTRLGPVTTARGWSRVVASWVTSPLWWTAHLIEAHYTRVGEGSPGEGMRLKRQILLRGKAGILLSLYSDSTTSFCSRAIFLCYLTLSHQVSELKSPVLFLFHHPWQIRRCGAPCSAIVESIFPGWSQVTCENRSGKRYT